MHRSTNGDGGEDDLSVYGSGRYVRMLGIDRVSLWRKLKKLGIDSK